jgi:hypothetical protein
LKGAQMPPRKKPTFESIDELTKAKKAGSETITIVVDGDVTVDWVMRGIGRKSFETLSNAHEDESTPSGWDMDTFAPSMIAACSEYPKLTQQQAKDLWDSDDWTTKDLDSLFRAALRVSSNLVRS